MPTSRATRVTSEVKSESWSTMPLNTVAISPSRPSAVAGQPRTEVAVAHRGQTRQELAQFRFADLGGGACPGGALLNNVGLR